MPNKYKKAFTLVEIITILVIISLLLISAVVAAPKQLVKARDSIRKNNIRRIVSAIEEVYQDTNCYPNSIPVCTNPIIQGDLTVLDNIPCDPKTKNSYVYVPENSSCPKWFQLYGILENTDDSIIDKVGCREGCGPQCQFNFGVASTNQILDPFCGESSQSPVPSSTPNNGQGEEIVDQYVCSPGGACEIYANPEISGCPDIYVNDPTCQDKCHEKIYRCHDAKGKTN